MREVVFDTILDSIRLIPFLFLTYLVMEWLEHRMGSMTARMVEKSGRFGPLAGAVLGVFPQCGFSAAAGTLYAGRMITLGTLFSVYLSTSDEMLPIMISEAVPPALVGRIIFCKIMVGLCVGILIDTLMRRHGRNREYACRKQTGAQAHCHCGGGVVKSAAGHTLHVTFFIFLVSFGLNYLLYEMGSDALFSLFLQDGILGVMLAGLIGLIPNCAASVMITQLYLNGVLNFGAMLSGLLTGSGIGLLVLYRVNDNWKENLCITAGLYMAGTVCGVMANAAGLACV